MFIFIFIFYRRSVRSGYAFAHQEGFGRLITSGKMMRQSHQQATNFQQVKEKKIIIHTKWVVEFLTRGCKISLISSLKKQKNEKKKEIGTSESIYPLNRLNSVGRGLASNPKMEYQVFLCIFQKNLAMATYGLKEMGKFLWEGREKGV